MTTKPLDYPHPVLDGIGNDFPECSFIAKVDANSSKDDGADLVLAMRTALDCPGMEAMVDDGRAALVVRARCPRTSYREIRQISTFGEFELPLEKSHLEETVTLEPMIVATAKGAEERYSLPEFNQSYFSGVSFQIRKGDILAIVPDITIKLQSTLTRDMAGIVQIARKENIEEPRVHYASNEDAGTERADYIYIYLPAKEHTSYGKLRMKRYFNQGSTRFLQCALVLPAITEAVGLLRDEELWYDDEESNKPTYQGTVWADSMRAALERHGVDSFTDETASNFELANKILGDVVGDALDNLHQKLEEIATPSYGDDEL